MNNNGTYSSTLGAMGNILTSKAAELEEEEELLQLPPTLPTAENSLGSVNECEDLANPPLLLLSGGGISNKGRRLLLKAVPANAASE